jgi:exosortase
VLWHDREHWTKTKIKPSSFRLPVMLGAVGLLLLGSLGAELYTARLSLVFLISGIILFLAGWKMLRSIAFPLGHLIWMIPIPAIIYYQITFPLQLIASRVASSWLELFRVPVLQDGNILILATFRCKIARSE